MPRRLRLDAELVRRGLARSREHAGELIAAGRVKVDGAVAGKAATGVGTDAALVVVEDPDPPRLRLPRRPQAGRRAGGLRAGGLEVRGRRCLDAGASTGGFTDVLLRAGAAEVVAVDVGYGQLAWSLRSDERVGVHDRTNVRDLTLDARRRPVDLVVGDLSFISLELVLDALHRGDRPVGGDLALMVKPQFEVGRERVGKGGVVRDPALRAEAVASVARPPPGVAGVPGPSPPARCPVRPATWSSSSGCAGAIPWSTRSRSAPRYVVPPTWGRPVRGWGRDRRRATARANAVSW